MLQSAPAHNDPMETKGIVAEDKQQNGDAARDRWTARRDYCQPPDSSLRWLGDCGQLWL